jgi:Kef-type K+ transport system membrane component KefB
MSSTTGMFLIAMGIIFTVPYAIWRFARTDYYAPLVVVQIITGILLGPGILGEFFPDQHAHVFNAPVVQSLTGIAWWSVMLFVWIAGIELDLKKAWENRRESLITAGLALSAPLLLGAIVGLGMAMQTGWVGPAASSWQFMLGVGMACAVTALPILMLFMEKMALLRQPIGQRILRYASLDDLAIWAVLALILMDWQRVGMQGTFLLVFGIAGYGVRRLMVRVPATDRWYLGLIWLTASALGAEWCGLHFMVGAFLSGVVLDSDWFDQQQMDILRHHVLLILMPVFFLSTGLKTDWSVGGETVFIAAAVLLIASVGGKLLGVHIAGRILDWHRGEASIIGWLLQTKALIMIIFANILMDAQIITSETFTALLLMAVVSTMLTVPMVSPKLARMRARLPEHPGGLRRP